MGIPTLIATLTASNDSSVADTSSMTSAYDEYMFVMTDIAPATDQVTFEFQVNADGESGYNEVVTSTAWTVQHTDADYTELHYHAAEDLAQGTGKISMGNSRGNGSDESGAGILHLFTPSDTTYVTHYYGRSTFKTLSPGVKEEYFAGYINVTGAITDIQFNMDSGNFDGVIQVFGIK